MTAVKLNIFSGIRPRLPESLLPEQCATIAQNCDLAYGELRNTNSGFLVANTTNRPKSIYTGDGTTFYTWPHEVDAVRCPMVSDTYNRLYFTDGANFQVTDRTGTRATGGLPSTSYSVGVPKPTVAPILAIAGAQDISNADLVFHFHYESGGIKYQEATITPTVITAQSIWKYKLPTNVGKDGGSGVTFKLKQWVPTDGSNAAFFSQSTVGSFDVVEAIIVSDTSLYYYGSDNVKRFQGGIVEVIDEDGFTHQLETLWSIAKYAIVNPGSTSPNTGSGTPSNAVPVVRLTATDKTTKEQLFDIYTANSAFTSTSTYWTLTMAKNTPDDGSYTITLSSTIAEKDKEARAYVYTFVNIYDEEGPPSPPASVTTSPVVPVTVKATLDNVGAYAPIKEIRIYRTPTGSAIADYFFSLSIPVLGQAGPTFTVTDDTAAAMLAEELASTDYYPPPADLVGIMSLPNGILCGWRKNELWFSEMYKPWAWPPSYCKPLSHAIVGGISQGSGAVITTTARPYMVSGVSPDSMTASKVNVEQAGVSKWSIASAEGAVVYASHDGLVVISGATGSLAKSEVFFTRDVWRQRYGQALGTMVFSVWDGRLVVFSNTGAFTPFMIRLDEADGTMTDLPDLTAACAFISVVSDQFYYGNGSAIYQFNGGDAQQAVWQSGERVAARPTNFAFAQAVVEGNWTIQFYAGGVLRRTKSVTTGVTNFRLPGGFKADRWKIKITGTGRFRELRFANSAVELSGV